jgi:hypothetical protein
MRQRRAPQGHCFSIGLVEVKAMACPVLATMHVIYVRRSAGAWEAQMSKFPNLEILAASVLCVFIIEDVSAGPWSSGVRPRRL